tara:strand:+ start:405 stop:1586 length:1182 start_codon:yes stop_codon:yes gene_type:complete
MDKSNRHNNLIEINNTFNIIKKNFIYIIIFSLVIFSFVFFVGTKLNKNAVFKSKTLIDGSKINVDLNSVGSFENIFNSFLKENTGDEEKKINFLDVFISTLKKDQIVKLLDKNNFLDKENYTNEQNYKNDLSKIYNQNLRIGVEKKLIFEDKINNSLWFLEFSGPLKKKEIWMNTLRELKKKTADEFKLKLINVLKSKLDVINIIINNDIRLIDEEIEYLLNENFHYKNQELLIFLKEQAAIAKELQIDNGLEYILKVVDSAEILNLNDRRGSDFLNFQWGYLAIERKIDEVNLRKKNDAKFHVREYQDLYNRKIILKRKSLYYNEIYDDLLNSFTFFTSNEDRETEYLNINSTIFSSNQISSIQLILVSVVLSIIINIIFVFIVIILQQKKS